MINRRIFLAGIIVAGAGLAGGADARARALSRVPVPYPPKAVMGYLETWAPEAANGGGPAILPRNVNLNYNVLILAFATVGEDGTASLWHDQDAGELKADIATWRKAKKPVLISVGGSGGAENGLGTAAAQNKFVASIERIVDDYGFSGLDWDLEEDTPDMSTAGMAVISRDLVARYGQDFSITMAPYSETVSLYKSFARSIKDILTSVNYQFYNLEANPTGTSMEGVVADWIETTGISAAQCTLGVMCTPDDWMGLQLSYSALKTVYAAVEEEHPTIRGAFTWGVNEDKGRGYQFAATAGPLVR